MTDIDFIIGFATGVVFYFLLDVVRDHQRRKQRDRQRRAALANRL